MLHVGERLELGKLLEAPFTMMGLPVLLSEEHC